MNFHFHSHEKVFKDDKIVKYQMRLSLWCSYMEFSLSYQMYFMDI